ncbi:MAG: MFS transporter [Dysgonamonadaceae bacterium]|nr:MFS transporter [Dysgonamonadaceae bacterium]
MKEKLWNKNFIQACIANFLMASSFHLLMPTIPIYLTQTLNIHTSKVGIVLSSYTLAMLMIRPFSGYIVDVFDRKKVFLLALALFVATFFGYLWAEAVALLMLVRFFHGLSWGMSTVSSNTVAIDIIPSTRRAEGVGYFGMNMNLAMAIAPFIAMYIYERSGGFHLLIFCSIAMGTLALIAASLIKTPVKEKQKNKPPLSVDRFILIKGIPLFLNQILVTTGWGMLVSFGVLYGNQIQIPNAGIFFLFLAAGLIISRVISGRFVDRGHIHVISILALSLITVSFLCFASLHTITAFCISAFFVGIGYGMMLPSFQTSFINMAANDRRGTANSTYLTAFDLGLGIGMLLGGFLAGSHPMAYIYLVSAGLAFCSVIMYIFVSRKVYDRNKITRPS